MNNKRNDSGGEERLGSLGPKTSAWLRGVGIGTLAELERLGAAEAYRRLQAAYPERVSLNALWGIQAAIMEIDWRDLPEDIKNQLKGEVGR